MVEVRGIEPLAPCLQSRCSPAELHPRYYLGCTPLGAAPPFYPLAPMRRKKIAEAHLKPAPAKSAFPDMRRYLVWTVKESLE